MTRSDDDHQVEGLHRPPHLPAGPVPSRTRRPPLSAEVSADTAGAATARGRIGWCECQAPRLGPAGHGEAAVPAGPHYIDGVAGGGSHPAPAHRSPGAARRGEAPSRLLRPHAQRPGPVVRGSGPVPRQRRTHLATSPAVRRTLVEVAVARPTASADVRRLGGTAHRERAHERAHRRGTGPRLCGECNQDPGVLDVLNGTTSVEALIGVGHEGMPSPRLRCTIN
jgi:hypothetical protein